MVEKDESPPPASAAVDRELTGNHYITFPDIDRRTGAVASLNVLHRGLNGLLSWCGAGPEDPLLRPYIAIDGTRVDLEMADAGRHDRWIPWMRLEGGALEATVTYCAPGGFNPIIRGAAIRIELRNRGSAPVRLQVGLHGVLAATTRTIRSTRALGSTFRVCRGVAEDGLAFEARDGGMGAAFGLCLDGQGRYELRAGGEAGAGSTGDWHVPGSGEEVEAGQGVGLRFRCFSDLDLGAGSRAVVSAYIGVAPERDGALASAAALAAIGARELIRLGRLDVTQLSRTAADPADNDLLNRNLVFAHYFAAARAVDDDRLYLLHSRVPGPDACTFNEREALLWTLPALSVVDPLLGKEALLRSFEQYSHRPGERLRYLDGSVLAPGMILDQMCAYPFALDRFVRETGDQSPLDEPIVQDVLREIDESLFSRLHPEILLCRSELLPSGERADHPYVAIGNALVWAFADALPRIVRPRRGEPSLRLDGAAGEIRAAFWQRCTVDVDGVRVIACTSDLKGNAAIYDDPNASLRLLPFIGLCDEDDPLWSDTMELLSSPRYPLWLGRHSFPGLAGRSAPTRASLPALCSRLLTAEREAALATLRALPLPAGVASEAYDPDNGECFGPYAAAVAGLLAWCLLHETKAHPRPDPDAARSRTEKQASAPARRR